MGNKSPGYKPERWCHSFGPIAYNLDTDILLLVSRHEFHVEVYLQIARNIMRPRKIHNRSLMNILGPRKDPYNR